MAQNASSRKGAARHFAKMKAQNKQVGNGLGAGAFTGGLATGAPAPVIPNTAAKTASIGVAGSPKIRAK